jgi:hypothetical protein
VACRGDAKFISEATTQEGVKDKIAQYWITQLLGKAKSLKETGKDTTHTKAAKEMLISEIEKELWEWLLQQPNSCGRTDVEAGIHYNPLLETRGTLFMEIAHIDT